MPTRWAPPNPTSVTPEQWRAAREEYFDGEAHAARVTPLQRRRMPMDPAWKELSLTAPGGDTARPLRRQPPSSSCTGSFHGSGQWTLPKQLPRLFDVRRPVGRPVHLRERDTRFPSPSAAASRSTCSAIASTWAGSSPWYTLRDDSTPDHDGEKVFSRRRRVVAGVFHRRPWPHSGPSQPGASSTSPEYAARKRRNPRTRRETPPLTWGGWHRPLRPHPLTCSPRRRRARIRGGAAAGAAGRSDRDRRLLRARAAE